MVPKNSIRDKVGMIFAKKNPNLHRKLGFFAKIWSKVKVSAEENQNIALMRCIMHQYIACVNIFLHSLSKIFLVSSKLISFKSIINLYLGLKMP